MFVKIHKATRYVVAICDEDLLGKKFEEGERGLDMTGTFFRGEIKTNQEVEELMRDMVREDASFNIVGKTACGMAIDVGLIDEKNMIYISGVPIALTLL